jgi:hypothetical protein
MHGDKTHSTFNLITLENNINIIAIHFCIMNGAFILYISDQVKVIYSV